MYDINFSFGLIKNNDELFIYGINDMVTVLILDYLTNLRVIVKSDENYFYECQCVICDMNKLTMYVTDRFEAFCII